MIFTNIIVSFFYSHICYRNFIMSLHDTIINKLGNDRTAYLYWLLGCIGWMLGHIYVNEHSINILSTNLSRSVGLLAWNACFIFSRKGKGLTIHKGTLGTMIIRNTILSLYGYIFAEAQFYLPVPIVYTIYYSGPLYIMIIDFCAYGIKITKKEAFGVGAAFLGVLLTANGLWLTDWLTDASHFTTDFQNYKTDSLLLKSLVGIVLIVSQLAWAYAIICVRWLKAYDHTEVNFMFGTNMIFIAGVFYQFNEDNAFDLDPWLFFKCFLFQGMVLSLAQSIQITSLLLTDKSGIMSMVGMLTIALSYVFSVFRYSENINYICLFGAVLVVLGVYQIVIK